MCEDLLWVQWDADTVAITPGPCHHSRNLPRKRITVFIKIIV